MKTTYISTQAASTASRLSILKMQTELAKNTKELSSGRWADVGLELGNKTGRTISLRQDYQRLDAIRDTNGLVASRLDTSQAALDGVLKNAQEFAASLIAVVPILLIYIVMQKKLIHGGAMDGMLKG